MKIAFKYISIVALIIISVSCSDDDETVNGPAPTASFTFEAVMDTPQIISFTNTSENADSYEWNFGDDSGVSHEKHPSHVYASAGSYNVVLKVFNQNKENEYAQELAVLGNPSANFSYQADTSVPFKINFQNLSQNTATYTWDFGDGSGTSNEENPSYTYASEGLYTVTLLSEGTGGSSTKSREIEVTNLLPPYGNLYVVGDATPSGWNIGSPEAFVQDNTDPFTFTYEGLLSPGAIKIATFTGDWCDGDWLNSPNDGDDLSGTQYIVTTACDGPDNKWSVTASTQGVYIITVNLYDETIKFELQ